MGDKPQQSGAGSHGVDRRHYIGQLRRLKASSMMLGMAKMGISSMLKGSKMVVHKVLKKLDDRSLAAILDFIEEIIHEPEAG